MISNKSIIQNEHVFPFAPGFSFSIRTFIRNVTLWCIIMVYYLNGHLNGWEIMSETLNLFIYY